MLFVECENLGLLTVRHVGDTDVKAEQNVGLHFDESRTHFFNAEGLTLRD